MRWEVRLESQAGGKEAEGFGLCPEGQGGSSRSLEKENDAVGHVL